MPSPHTPQHPLVVSVNDSADADRKAKQQNAETIAHLHSLDRNTFHTVDLREREDLTFPQDGHSPFVLKRNSVGFPRALGSLLAIEALLELDAQHGLARPLVWADADSIFEEKYLDSVAALYEDNPALKVAHAQSRLLPMPGVTSLALFGECLSSSFYAIRFVENGYATRSASGASITARAAFFAMNYAVGDENTNFGLLDEVATCTIDEDYLVMLRGAEHAQRSPTERTVMMPYRVYIQWRSWEERNNSALRTDWAFARPPAAVLEDQSGVSRLKSYVVMMLDYLRPGNQEARLLEAQDCPTAERLASAVCHLAKIISKTDPEVAQAIQEEEDHLSSICRRCGNAPHAFQGTDLDRQLFSAAMFCDALATLSIKKKLSELRVELPK